MMNAPTFMIKSYLPFTSTRNLHTSMLMVDQVRNVVQLTRLALIAVTLFAQMRKLENHSAQYRRQTLKAPDP